MNNFEKIKAMNIDELAETLVACINIGEAVAVSPVLSNIYHDDKKCIEDTKQWLESESEG